MAVVIGFGLMTSAGVLFWSFLPQEDQTHPLLKFGALSWVLPLTVASLLAIGLTLALDGLLRS